MNSALALMREPIAAHGAIGHKICIALRGPSCDGLCGKRGIGKKLQPAIAAACRLPRRVELDWLDAQFPKQCARAAFHFAYAARRAWIMNRQFLQTCLGQRLSSERRRKMRPKWLDREMRKMFSFSVLKHDEHAVIKRGWPSEVHAVSIARSAA